MADKKDKRAQTIAPELLATWQKLKRHGDAATLTEVLRKSRPTIDNALAYGAVHDPNIIEGINKFFADRLKNEVKEAERLDWLGKVHGKVLPVGAEA